jgi:hypothetical protein
MAHAYTTKRGKNKMSKLGVRKDQQQNNERTLKNPVSQVIFFLWMYYYSAAFSSYYCIREATFSY